MANTKISQLTENTNPSGGEELVYAYNNANGKMTLNTMKTFAGSGKQDTLVSGTNIKTINSTSLLGSGNIDIAGTNYTAGTGIDITGTTISNTGVVSVKTINGSSIVGTGNVDISGGVAYTAGTGIDITNGVISTTGGSGGSGYDAIVDSAGGGDYTTVAAALTAGCKSVFVKAGTYTESTWDATSRDVTIIGEMGAVVNFASLTSSGTTGYVMRVTSGHNYYISGLEFNVTSGFSFFSSYTTTTSNNKLFKVINCTLNISSITQMFYSGGLDLIGNSGATGNGLYWTSNAGNNGFENCIINISSSTFELSNTGTSTPSVPYIRCRIYGASTEFKGNKIVLEYSTIEALSYKSIVGVGNTVTVSAKGTGDSYLEIKYLNNSRLNLPSTFTDAVRINDCSGLLIDIEGTPSSVRLEGSVTDCRMYADNAVTINCMAYNVTGCYFSLSSNSVVTLDNDDCSFVGNTVSMNNTCTINIFQCKDCVGNIMSGALNIGKDGVNNTFISFCNNSVRGNSACSIYCSNAIISGNKLGTGAYTKPVIFYSGAERNIFTSNYMYSCTLNSGSGFNIVVGNILYSNSSVSDSGTSNVIDNNA